MNMFDPGVAPFSLSLSILTLLVAVEAIGMVFGASITGMGDDAFGDAGADAAPDGASGGGGSLLSWLGIGRVPVMMVLGGFLLSFSVIGLAGQALVASATGGVAPVWLSAPAAFVAALPPTRWIGWLLARVLPKEETDAVSRDTFVGRIAIITRGEARAGLPAEAKLKDSSGQAHYVLVEPDEDGTSFPAGSHVLLVEKVGATFRGVPNPSQALTGAAPG